jgi:hypothetical protein
MNYIAKISHTSVWLLFAAFTFGFAAQSQAQSQSTPRIEAGVDYSYVRSNTPPGAALASLSMVEEVRSLTTLPAR